MHRPCFRPWPLCHTFLFIYSLSQVQDLVPGLEKEALTCRNSAVRLGPLIERSAAHLLPALLQRTSGEGEGTTLSSKLKIQAFP